LRVAMSVNSCVGGGRSAFRDRVSKRYVKTISQNYVLPKTGERLLLVFNRAIRERPMGT
jgi:hypothetical protein